MQQVAPAQIDLCCQQALVLGSSGYIQPNPTEPAQYAQLVDSHSIRSLTEI